VLVSIVDWFKCPGLDCEFQTSFSIRLFDDLSYSFKVPAPPPTPTPREKKNPNVSLQPCRLYGILFCVDLLCGSHESSHFIALDSWYDCFKSDIMFNFLHALSVPDTSFEPQKIRTRRAATKGKWNQYLCEQECILNKGYVYIRKSKRQCVALF